MVKAKCINVDNKQSVTVQEKAAPISYTCSSLPISQNANVTTRLYIT